MNIIHTFILSIVEGITEFLPISSTGHLILTSHLLQIPQSEFLKTFEISIQLGAICSVLFLYWKKLLTRTDLVKKVLVAFLPTAVVGFLLYPFIKTYLLSNAFVTLLALFFGGIALILIEKFFAYKNYKTKNLKKITLKDSFLIGVFQSLSVVPGVSRAAATIFGGLFMRLDRTSATEFSFLLAVPTMAAATGYDLLQTSGSFNQSDYLSLLIGFVMSFFVAILSIKFLLGFVKKNNFIGFGIYRIILSLIYFLFVLN